MLVRWIPGYVGSYAATSEGKILSYQYDKRKYISSFINNSGYACVHLWKNNKRKLFRIHRIIGELFIPNPENKPQLNHISGIKTDNRVTNLEWVNNSENIQHAYNLGLLKPRKGEKHHKYDHKIYTFKHPDHGIVKCTRFELVNKYNLTATNLNLVVRGVRKTCKGWILINEEN